MSILDKQLVSIELYLFHAVKEKNLLLEFALCHCYFSYVFLQKVETIVLAHRVDKDIRDYILG